MATFTTSNTAFAEGTYTVTTTASANAFGDFKTTYNGTLSNWNYYEPTYTGGKKGDFYYDPNYSPIYPNTTPNIWPTIPQQTPQYPTQPTVTTTWTVSCPHCGHSHQISNYLNFNWICQNCNQSMLLFNVGIDLPGLGTYPAAPATPAKAPAPAPTQPALPEKRDSHPGDGSRWEDI